jgi:hypothetical protein
MATNDPNRIEPGATEEIVDPTIDDFLNGQDERIGRDRPCPICGATDWAVIQPNPLSFLGTSLVSTEARALNVAILICARCRFIRSHLLTPLATDEGAV